MIRTEPMYAIQNVSIESATKKVSVNYLYLAHFDVNWPTSVASIVNSYVTLLIDKLL